MTVVGGLAAERFSQHIPEYFKDDPERCAARRLALLEALDSVGPDDRCGTIAGYERHRRIGERCPECSAARREYDRNRYMGMTEEAKCRG